MGSIFRLAFALFDTNHDNTIDFVEFLMANAFATSTSRKEALGYLFDMYVGFPSDFSNVLNNL